MFHGWKEAANEGFSFVPSKKAKQKSAEMRAMALFWSAVAQ
jgi:hypothetical protein